MAGMAVYRTPPAPGAWAGSDIVRIVDPLGLAIAWVAPELGGACIGFSVREDTGSPWRTVFESEPPRDQGVDDLLGLEPLIGTDEGPVLPARMSDERWSMLERDPTSVTVGSDGQEGNSTVTVACESGALEMTLTGDRFAGVRIHLPDADWRSLRDDPATDRSRDRITTISLPDTAVTIASPGDLVLSASPPPDPNPARLELRANLGLPHNPIHIRLVLESTVR